MNQQLTWLQLSRLENGTRVVFAEPHDIFPITIIERGTVATVVNNSLNEIYCMIAVLPDNRKIRHELREWDGEVQLDNHTELDSGADPQDMTTEWHTFSPLALLSEDKPTTAYVVIDYDQDAPYLHSDKEYDPDRKYVVLEMIAYSADDKITGSLCEIDFFADEDMPDWTLGTFYRVDDIPPVCTHLRQIAEDLGLPA